MNELRSVQLLLDDFNVARVLRLNLETCKDLKQLNLECLLLKEAIRLLEQTIEDIESDAIAEAALRQR